MRRRFNASASLKAYGTTSFAGFEKSVATRIVRFGCAAVLMLLRSFHRRCVHPHDDGTAADGAVILQDGTVEGFL